MINSIQAHSILQAVDLRMSNELNERVKLAGGNTVAWRNRQACQMAMSLILNFTSPETWTLFLQTMADVTKETVGTEEVQS